MVLGQVGAVLGQRRVVLVQGVGVPGQTPGAKWHMSIPNQGIASMVQADWPLSQHPLNLQTLPPGSSVLEARPLVQTTCPEANVAAMLHTIGVKFGLIIAEVRVAHDAQRNWAFK